MTELLIGTKKGLFVLEGTPADGFEVTARAFPGQSVEYAMRDPRTGRYLACLAVGLLRTNFGADLREVEVTERIPRFTAGAMYPRTLSTLAPLKSLVRLLGQEAARLQPIT